MLIPSRISPAGAEKQRAKPNSGKRARVWSIERILCATSSRAISFLRTLTATDRSRQRKLLTQESQTVDNQEEKTERLFSALNASVRRAGDSSAIKATNPYLQFVRVKRTLTERFTFLTIARAIRYRNGLNNANNGAVSLDNLLTPRREGMQLFFSGVIRRANTSLTSPPLGTSAKCLDRNARFRTIRVALLSRVARHCENSISFVS